MEVVATSQHNVDTIEPQAECAIALLDTLLELCLIELPHAALEHVHEVSLFIAMLAKISLKERETLVSIMNKKKNGDFIY